MTTPDYTEPHEFKPGQCAGCGKWHTNEIHEAEPDEGDA